MQTTSFAISFGFCGKINLNGNQVCIGDSGEVCADVHAKVIQIDGKVTGEVKGIVVDGQRKAELLAMLAKQEGIALEQVIAVGDGANDLAMLEAAGLGVAFRAKPKVRDAAAAFPRDNGAIITHGDLTALLYLQGYRAAEFC